MNRTFNAFGVLLALLVLTTLAVSSSSRSTTVRRVPVTARHNVPPQQHPGGATFVIILPAENSDDSASKMTPARVELAIQASAFSTTLALLDRRFYVDEVYDFTVYGESSTIEPHTPRNASDCQLDAEEIVGIFKAINATSLNQARKPMTSRLTWQVGQLRTLLLGLQNWLGQHSNHLPLAWLWKHLLARPSIAPAAITWTEYSELIEHATCAADAPLR